MSIHKEMLGGEVMDRVRMVKGIPVQLSEELLAYMEEKQKKYNKAVFNRPQEAKE